MPTSDLQFSLTSNPKNEQLTDFSFAMPDTTEKAKLKTQKEKEDAKKIFGIDTTKKTVKDSVKKILSHADSLKLKVKQDSLAHIEAMSKDSTARLKYFRYQREDLPNVLFRPKKPSAFFIQPSQAFTNRVSTLDSTGKKVQIKETIAGKQVKTYLEMPLDEYIKLRMDAITRDAWEQKGYEYKLNLAKKDFSQLLTDITNIEIPLPSTPLLSIFGTPKINIKINGQVDIHGAWRNETTTGVTTSALGNTRNEPDFKQQVQINLSGTIGDKLTLGADWNTERQFQYENQLKIKYTGYDDEIIQSIEAGNVSLQTSPLVGGSEALFGVKAQFKMGPFSLTALASQKKSEVQEKSLSSGAETKKFEIHAYDYSPNHFFVDSVYASAIPRLNMFKKYYNNAIPTADDSTRYYYVREIEVWKSVTGLIDKSRERRANVYVDLPRRQKGQLYSKSLRDTSETVIKSTPGEILINNRFVLLSPGDYDFHPETGYITFKTQIQDQDAIAVAYRVQGPTPSEDDDVFYGEFLKDVMADSTAKIILKLVKPPNLQPQFKKAWKLQLRNIYPVGGRALKEEGFQFDIKFLRPGQEPQNNYEGTKLLEAFGLDRTDKSGLSPNPDGAFDFFRGRTIFTETGEIVFPVLQPFGKDFPKTLPDSLKYQSIYDTTATFARQDRSRDKFILSGEYSAAVSSVFSLGLVGIVENSVRVILNGAPLKEGVDYTVDYNLGQVMIRKAEALVPGADLKITYEQNDLFQLASKTLLGFRGLYEFNRDTQLGFSFLNLNQQTLSDKVRIGEEPLKNSIFGVDFKTTIDLPFITKGLDKLISTSAPSNFTLTGEAAYINPDPNTKKSTIASDEGKSIAYIDDFEGAKRIIPLGMSYGSWHDISIPDKLPFIGNLPAMNMLPVTSVKDAQMNYKAKTYWFNITPSDVNIKDIYGDRKSSAPGDASQIQALDFVFDPAQKGAYNWFPSITDTKKNWGGFMKVLSSTANNLIEENIGFIEFWLYLGTAQQKDLKLNIDLGQISEDVIPDGRLNTESKSGIDILYDGEDTGLDGLKDADEPGYDPVTNPDPSADNYSFQYKQQNTDFSHVNGTEGSAVSSEIGRIPDTEDLNRNGTLDRVNSYFRYSVPLDTNKTTNPFVKGSITNRGWYLFRVPLKDISDKIGTPSLSVIETIRFWVSGASAPVHLRFAEMNLVGNQWQKVLNPPLVTADDTVMTVATASLEDNPEYYSPPGVFQERDRTQPNYNIYKNEQSLELRIKKLDDGDKREVVRYLTRPLDVFSYKELKFFIHGDNKDMDGSVSHYVDANNYASEVYLRFGADSTNYYEYRQPVKADWNEVSMKFSELTAIKQRRDSVSIKNNTTYSVVIPDQPGHSYGVRGNPTLTRISFFTIGIVNPKNKGAQNQSVSGNVWINELRVLEAEQTPGWAYSANAGLQFADLMRISGNISQTNPYFHRLAERFGSREDRLNWGVAIDFDLIKIIPLNLAGSNFRISYSRNEQAANPIYIPGTDISVEEAQKELRKSLTDQGRDPAEINKLVEGVKSQSQTVNVSETWTLSSVRFKIPTDLWYIRDIFNNITLGFNYNKTYGRTPTTASTESWIWNANASYAVNLSKDLYFMPVNIPLIGDFFNLFDDYRDMKVYFLPQTLTTSFTASRRRTFTQDRNPLAKPNTLRDFTATRSAGFTWGITEGGFLNTAINYNFDVSSTLANLLTYKDENGIDLGIERKESEIWRDIFRGAIFGKDYMFRQNFDVRFNPKLPSLFDINRFVNVNLSYSVTYNWQNNLQQGDLGRSAGYGNKINAGFTLRLKSMVAPLFKEEPKAVKQPQQQQSSGTTGGRRSRRGGQTQQTQQDVPQQQPEANKISEIGKVVKTSKDSLALKKDSLMLKPDSLALKKKSVGAQSDSTEFFVADSIKGPSTISVSLEYLKLGVKWLLLDYDQIQINFTQSSSYTGGALRGEGSGFNNFWGIKQSSDKGPSRLFILGFSNDLGPRTPNASNIQDNYSQKNDIDFKTSRPLWEGAQLELSWRVGWGVNRSTALQTDSLGNVSVLNPLSTGSINRSFLSLPPVFFLSFLGNGIKKVHDLYNPDDPNPNENLSQAFLKGFETFSFISKIPILGKFMKYIPRPNWSFTWSGLEQMSIFSWAKRVTISHAYTSTYDEGWKTNISGSEEIQTQRVDYGFSPLIGLTFNIDNLLGGNFQSTVRYQTKSSYSLGVTTRNIIEGFTKGMSVTASYSKSGFELPLFGISLKNDLEVSFSYTNDKTSSILYEMDQFSESGKPQEGKTNTVIEPKIKYVMSSRVTLSIFYRRTSITPEGASRIPPTTTNEAGVDVRIAIQ